MALYKVPAAKQINKYTLSVWSYLFASLIAAAALYRFISVDQATILLALLWGTGYAVLSLVQMHVLHTQDTSSVFPFTSVASNVLVVIGGVTLLNEHIAPLQWLAIALAIALLAISYWNDRVQFVIGVLPSFLFISLLSTANKFVQKAAADQVNVYNFIFWELLFALIASFIILLYVRKQVAWNELAHRPMLAWALISGALQAGASYAIVLALSLGPMSLVYTILGLYTFFTALLAKLFFKERVTTKNVLFILCSFLVVLLIKFG